MTLIRSKELKSGNFRKKIADWNNRYPIDFVWRRFYNVRYGSPEHLAMDFFSMLWQLIEDKDVKKSEALHNKSESGKSAINSNDTQQTEQEEFEKFTAEEHDGASYVEKMSDKEIDQYWEELDIYKLNQKYYKDELSTGSRIQSD